MTRGSGSYYDRYPSARPPQPKLPDVPKKSFEQRISELHIVLATALPHLQRYANFEPHARPIYVKHGLRKGYTGGWEFGRHVYTAIDSEAYHPSRTRLHMLTEDGFIGTEGDIYGGASGYALNVERVRRLGERSLSKLDLLQPDALQAATTLETVLANTGHQIALRNLIND